MPILRINHARVSVVNSDPADLATNPPHRRTTPRPDDSRIAAGAFGVVAAIVMGLLGEIIYVAAAILPVVFVAWWFYDRLARLPLILPGK